MKGMAIVKFPDYSVLMSVYKKENEDHLRIAMDSIWNQTVRTNDFVGSLSIVGVNPNKTELE